MESTIVLIALVIQVASIIVAATRYGFSPFPTLAVIYLTLAQMSLLLVSTGVWDYPFLQVYTRGGYQDYFLRTILIYSFISLAIMAAFAGEIASGKSQKLKLPKVDLSRIARAMGTFNLGFAVFVVCYFAILSLVLDWSIVWANSIYLLMTRPQAVITVKGLGLLLSLLPFVGIVAGVVAAINISVKKPGAAILFAVVALMITLYYIGAHQRVALLPSVAFFVVLSVVGQKRHLFLRGGAGVLAVVSQASALSGRNSGSHGLSSIPDAFTGIAQADILDLLSGLIMNVTEGIFVLAEGFTRSPEWPMIYKVLSFSPLPSAIDGFADVNFTYQQRLTRYVPLSGWSEAYFFGPFFLAALIVLFWGGLMIYRKVLKRNQYIGLAVGLLLLLAIIMIFAYPLRNAFKPYWLSVIIGSVALLYYRNKPIKRPAAVDRSVQMALAGPGRLRPARPALQRPLATGGRRTLG